MPVADAMKTPTGPEDWPHVVAPCFPRGRRGQTSTYKRVPQLPMLDIRCRFLFFFSARESWTQPADPEKSITLKREEQQKVQATCPIGCHPVPSANLRRRGQRRAREANPCASPYLPFPRAATKQRTRNRRAKRLRSQVEATGRRVTEGGGERDRPSSRLSSAQPAQENGECRQD